jgi:hypothetical protein
MSENVGRFGYTSEEWIFLRNDEVRESWNVAKYTILPTLIQFVNIASARDEQLLYASFLQLHVIEITALHHYTRHGDFYRILNRQIAQGKLDQFNQAFASLLRQALDKLPPYVGTVYRGTVLEQTDCELWYVEGKVVTHHIFTSTSLSKYVAGVFIASATPLNSQVAALLIIQSKNGKYISPVSEFNGIFAGGYDQEEVLFVNDTDFMVEAITTVEQGFVHVNLTEL